LIRISII